MKVFQISNFTMKIQNYELSLRPKFQIAVNPWKWFEIRRPAEVTWNPTAESCLHRILEWKHINPIWRKAFRRRSHFEWFIHSFFHFHRSRRPFGVFSFPYLRISPSQVQKNTSRQVDRCHQWFRKRSHSTSKQARDGCQKGTFIPVKTKAKVSFPN